MFLVGKKGLKRMNISNEQTGYLISYILHVSSVKAISIFDTLTYSANEYMNDTQFSLQPISMIINPFLLRVEVLKKLAMTLKM